MLLYFVGCIYSDFPSAQPWSHISLLTGRIHWLQHYKNYKIILFYNDYCSCPSSLLSCFLTLLYRTFCTPTLFPEIARKSEFFETSNFCDCSVNSSLRHSSDRFQIENPTPWFVLIFSYLHILVPPYLLNFQILLVPIGSKAFVPVVMGGVHCQIIVYNTSQIIQGVFLLVRPTKND